MALGAALKGSGPGPATFSRLQRAKRTTESGMRLVLMLMAVLIGGGIGLSSRDAVAGPLPAVAVSDLAATMIENAGWRRNWRRPGYGPEIVLPDAEVDIDVNGDGDVDVPAIIVLPPPRPLSCGEYRYWNGDRCVDARYNNPYIGPK